MAQENKLPPVTEEDAPAVKKMIERLNRMRKREAMHNGWPEDWLANAINKLTEYGKLKDWWK